MLKIPNDFVSKKRAFWFGTSFSIRITERRVFTRLFIYKKLNEVDYE